MKVYTYEKYGSPDVLHLKEMEKPVPKDNEILIKIKATTVSVADIRARSFNVPRSVWLPARFALGLTQPKKPILGMELAGIVEGVGKNVTVFKEGDHVYAATLKNFGSYAEYICLPEFSPVYFKPDNMSFEEASAVPIGARTALFFLEKAKIKEGQNVLVYGASGSVGTYAVQLAKHFGATVTGVCSTTNLELVTSLGADTVIDYTVENFSLSRETYDVIFEAVGKSSFSDCMKVLKKYGIYINIVSPLPTPHMMWSQLKNKPKLILSQNAPENAETLIYLKELIEAGKLKAVIDNVYPFDELVEAHRYVEKGHKKGNVVIAVDNEKST